MRKVAYVVSALILTGCGGGGGSGTDNKVSNLPVAEPTLNITSSRTKALIDEPITISWNSSGFTSCTLNTTTENTIPTSGNKSVTYLSAGDKQVKISCSNSTKTLNQNINISVNVPTTYSVNTNVTENVYYNSYVRPTTNSADLEKDKCDLDRERVAYPKTFIGQRPLVAITGDKLDNSIQRMIFLKDAMGKDNPAEIPGCKGDLKKEISKTIKRIKDLNADYVVLVQWQWVSTRADGSWYIMSVEESSYGAARLNDEEFLYAANEAKKLGLKVATINQIQGMVKSTSEQTAFQPEDTLENVKKFYPAYKEWIINRAKFYQSAGVDFWQLDCNGCVKVAHDNGDKARSEYIRSAYIEIVNSINVYKGLLFTTPFNWLKTTPTVYNRIDGILSGLHIPDMKQADEDNMTVEKFKHIMKQSTNHIKNEYGNSGKAIFIATGATSRRGSFTNNSVYIDEICPVNDKSTCDVDKWETDFSLQAMYHEAAFQTINESGIKNQVFVGVADMLVTDILTPYMIYPNVMHSIRNKPAEGVVKHYFAR